MCVEGGGHQDLLVLKCGRSIGMKPHPRNQAIKRHWLAKFILKVIPMFLSSFSLLVPAVLALSC